jgi:prepilin signal peptidase PulO-like enzyme (type II secretory pathway)
LITHATLLLDVIFVYNLELALLCKCMLVIQIFVELWQVAPITVTTVWSSRTCKAVISVRFFCLRIVVLFLCPKLWINQNSGIIVMVFLIVTNCTILQEVLENSLHAHSSEPTQHQWNCLSLIHDLCMTVNSWINVEGQLIELTSAMWHVDKIMHSTTFHWPGL